MSEPHTIYFEIPPRACTKEFVEEIIDVMLNNGWRYEQKEGKLIGYFDNDKEGGDWVWGGSLDDGVITICEENGGAFKFWHADTEIEISLAIYPTSDMYSSFIDKNILGCISISIENVYLALSDEEVEKNAKIFIDTGKALYIHLKPLYGFGEHESNLYTEYLSSPTDQETLSRDIKHIYWVNFFSPELVQKIGREKLLSAPSYKTEELKDGGILLILGVMPYELEVEREEVEKYLGFKH